MPATVHTLYPAKISKPELTRADDERELEILAANADLVSYNEAGEPFVSGYLLKPIRTEQQAREDRAKLHPVFASILSPFAPGGV